MKVGIVTVHDSPNYGSFLQAYALQNVLEGMGHDVYFLRTRKRLYILKHFLFKGGDLKSSFPNFFLMYKIIRDGFVKYMAFKSEWKCFKTLDHASDIELDKIILGSDEIWNASNPVFRKPIFYGVGLDNVTTYGISVSGAKKDTFDDYPDLLKAIRGIDPILVRDQNTKNVVDSITGKESMMVADPTFLCDLSVFEKEIKNYSRIKQKYILVYSYRVNDALRDNILRFAKENNLLVVSACMKHEWSDLFVNGSPLMFCSLLKDADYVVTTTFHGTVFSILTHKRFVAEPFSPKVTDVLDKVELSNALIEKDSSYETFCYKLKNNFDYTKVDENVLKWRERSIRLLKEQLD